MDLEEGRLVLDFIVASLLMWGFVIIMEEIIKQCFIRSRNQLR